MRHLPFHMRLMAACLFLSGVTFAKPVIQVSNDADGFVIADYTVSVPPGNDEEILLTLSEADAAKLSRLTKAKLGERIVVTIGGTQVLTPVVKDVIAGRDLKLSFPDAASLATVRNALAK